MSFVYLITNFRTFTVGTSQVKTMRKSDLAELLSVLGIEERIKLRNYLLSPYHVEQKATEPQLRLLEFTCNQIDGLQGEICENEEYAQIFPKGEKVKNKLEKLKSELLGNLRAFLALEHHQKKYGGELQHLALADFYINKGLYHHYLKSRKQLLAWEAAQNKTAWLPEDYSILIEIHNLHTSYAVHAEYDVLEAAYPAMMDAINTQFGYFRLYFSMMYQGYLTYHNKNADQEIRQLRAIKDWQGFDSFFATVQGSLIKNALDLQFIAANEVESLSLIAQRAKETYQDNINKFHPYIARNMGSAIFNRIPKNLDKKLDAINFEIYKTRTEFLLSDRGVGRIHENELLGGINFALLSGDIPWAKWLIKEAESKITAESNPEGILHYCNSFILYAEKRHEEALDLIVTGQYDLPMLKATAKVLEVQILYDMNHDLLVSRVEAAKVFFHRDKDLPLKHKEANNHFIDIIKRLIRPGNTFDIKKLERILEDIRSTDNLARQSWLDQITLVAIEKAKRKR